MLSVKENNRSLEEKLNLAVETKMSYADAAGSSASQTNIAKTIVENSDPPKQVSDLKKIIREARNEELDEERERKVRACNLIIHGVPEQETNRKPLNAFDTDFVVNFIIAIGSSATFKSVTRLGKKEEGKTRPLKIVLDNEMWKNEILGNLPSLKGVDIYKRISVTEDYTISEREQIRSYVLKAKELNQREASGSLFEWKVRGTPKNGLQVKKFRKRNPPPPLH